MGKSCQQSSTRVKPDGSAAADALALRSSNEAAEKSKPLSTPAPLVSVVMPILNERRYIKRSLSAVLDQDYPRDRFEVLVADGMSTDGTREIIRGFQQEHPHLRLLDNPSERRPQALNLGTRSARGEIIVRVDGHCEIEPDYLRRCVRHLDEGVDCVGGPIETIGEGVVAVAVAAAMSSRFGVGGSPFRMRAGEERLVDTVAFPAYRRQTIERLGPYDESLLCNEDDEFNYRLRKSGGKILLASDVRSRYYGRSTLSGLWKQYFRYGYWKVRVLQRHPRQMRLRQFVPVCFVTVLLGLLCALPWSEAARWGGLVCAAAYLLANLSASLFSGWTVGWKAGVLLPLIFAIIHFAYGVGFLLGLLAFWNQWGRDTSPAAASINA